MPNVQGGLCGIGSNKAYSHEKTLLILNEAQYSIFAQMAAATSNPALALQAFFTNLFAITYYDLIFMFDSALPSSQISLVQVIRPLGWTAYVVLVCRSMRLLFIILI